jgi:hypothetical protein
MTFERELDPNAIALWMSENAGDYPYLFSRVAGQSHWPFLLMSNLQKIAIDTATRAWYNYIDFLECKN